MGKKINEWLDFLGWLFTVLLILVCGILFFLALGMAIWPLK